MPEPNFTVLYGPGMRIAQQGVVESTEIPSNFGNIEDYVELIADLIDEQGEARAVDIAKRLGVTGATVNKMIARLKQMDLVNAEPYRSVFLTDEGRQIAEASRARHHIVVALLRVVGVDGATAWADAEGMEHRCSPETLMAFKEFVKKHKS